MISRPDVGFLAMRCRLSRAPRSTRCPLPPIRRRRCGGGAVSPLAPGRRRESRACRSSNPAASDRASTSPSSPTTTTSNAASWPPSTPAPTRTYNGVLPSSSPPEPQSTGSVLSRARSGPDSSKGRAHRLVSRTPNDLRFRGGRRLGAPALADPPRWSHRWRNSSAGGPMHLAGDDLAVLGGIRDPDALSATRRWCGLGHRVRPVRTSTRGTRGAGRRATVPRLRRGACRRRPARGRW